MVQVDYCGCDWVFSFGKVFGSHWLIAHFINKDTHMPTQTIFLPTIKFKSPTIEYKPPTTVRSELPLLLNPSSSLILAKSSGYESAAWVSPSYVSL